MAGLAALFWYVIKRRWPSLTLLAWALTAEITIFLVDEPRGRSPSS